MRLKRHNGFTLIELLVVIGIMVILIGLLAPMAYRAYKTGKASKVKADFGAIATALEAYKVDFGDYPRPTADNTGFAELCKALIAPGGAVGYMGTTDGSPMDPTVVPPTFSGSKTYKAGEIVLQGSAPGLRQPNTSIFVCTSVLGTTATPADPSPAWALFWPFDGETGPGFRSRPTIGGVKQGKVHGPYLNPGRMTVRGMALVDGEGNPILYFPAAQTKPNTTKPNGYIGRPYTSTAPPAGTEKAPLYNEFQGLVFFRHGTEADDTNSEPAFHAMLGDMNYNGQIDPGEEQVSVPYILWAAGADGLFGPKGNRGSPTKKDVADCDDVANFR